MSYTGILPDLFKEGTGIVANGEFVNGRVEAEEILAKHDENYMPPQVKMRGIRRLSENMIVQFLIK